MDRLSQREEVAERGENVRSISCGATQGHSWGYFKCQFSKDVATLLGKERSNGSKNDPGTPPRRAFRGVEVGSEHNSFAKLA